MIVVTNASPLIALSQAEVLPILKQLFSSVLMPDTVYQETVIGMPSGCAETGHRTWHG